MIRLLLLLGILALSTVLASCDYEKVPPGYVGMEMSPDGLKKKILPPGKHNMSTIGRSYLVLIENREANMKEKLSILCKDDLNFKLDVNVRVRPRIESANAMAELINKQGSKLRSSDGNKYLTFDVLYHTYLRPVIRSVTRSMVSKYSTTDIRANRDNIQRDIQKMVVEATKGTPVKISAVVLSNFDYPKIITEAMEKKRTREISIQEEKAKQAIALLKADNRLKIAQKLKVVRVAEAEAESVYIQILGKAINNPYLKMRSIEAKIKLYQKVGAGDKVIVTNGEYKALPVTKRAIFAPTSSIPK
jgi:hypothetical protein